MHSNGPTISAFIFTFIMMQSLGDRLILSKPWLQGILCTLVISAAPLTKAEGVQNSPSLGQDDSTFVFMGVCPNGAMYRLKAYDKWSEGASRSFYDYEGPAGQGTIQTQTPPKTLAVRVCRALAEIVGDS